MIIDTHSHLYFKSLLTDIDGILERAYNSGINKIIVPSVDLKTADIALKLSEMYEMIYPAVGFHPSDIKDIGIQELNKISDYIKHNKVVAIGEIGLDYYWDKSYNSKQIEFFREQIEIALESNLPVIIHTRESMPDAIEIVNSYKTRNIKGQFHCFSGNLDELNKVISMNNFCVSFCGNITYKNYKGKDVILNTPLDKILLETDAPFLTPLPVKKKANEPSNIIYTAQKIADLRNEDLENILDTSYRNSMNLYFTEKNR